MPIAARPAGPTSSEGTLFNTENKIRNFTDTDAFRSKKLFVEPILNLSNRSLFLQLVFFSMTLVLCVLGHLET